MVSTIAFHFEGNTIHKLFAGIHLVDVVIEDFELYLRSRFAVNHSGNWLSRG